MSQWVMSSRSQRVNILSRNPSWSSRDTKGRSPQSFGCPLLLPQQGLQKGSFRGGNALFVFFLERVVLAWSAQTSHGHDPCNSLLALCQLHVHTYVGHLGTSDPQNCFNSNGSLPENTWTMGLQLPVLVVRIFSTERYLLLSAIRTLAPLGC